MCVGTNLDIKTSVIEHTSICVCRYEFRYENQCNKNTHEYVCVGTNLDMKTSVTEHT